MKDSQNMTDGANKNRRSFLKHAAITAAAGMSAIQLSPAKALASSFFESPEYQSANKAPISPAEFKRRLEGPIWSNPMPFNAKFDVDYQAIRKTIQRALRYGIRIFALTAGNSQYQSLTYDEIKESTRVMVESVSGQGITIAATGDWWTGQAVDYARYAESIGADAVQVLLPSRSSGEDSIVTHFETIARSTRLALVLHGIYSESLLKKLLKIDSIVAMKEDHELTYFIDRQIEFGDRISIFGGGQEYRYMVGYPYGAKAFYSTYSTFAPDISMLFWKAIQSGDLKAAAKITTKYDRPYLKNFTHSWWHATLEYFGVAQRYLRPPQVSYTDEQMKEVKRFFDAQGLNPAAYK
jgi:dihydrodipicolinate synthase/N-acetylneuraminate lyase